MLKNLDFRYDGRKCYSVVFTDSYLKLTDSFNGIETCGRKLCIVSDSEVAPLYLKQVSDALSPLFSKIVTFVFKNGEASKNLDVIMEIIEFLIKNGFDRKDMLAALGGGVCGDMTGFAASIYLRGIRFFQLPTSLLSMVDSSIGGKTGVDFKSYKNMVGAFYMPVLVYVNVSVLKTLPKDEYYAGYGEIIKHGLIADRKMVDFLDTSFVKLSAMDTETMLEMIYNNVNIKRKVVEEDPKEDGLRAILNFGHTCGHAIEKQSGLKMLHGQCVAVGCVCACYISYKRGLITKEDLSFIEKLFQKYNLPVRIKGFDAEQVVETTSKDKKKDGGCIRFILIQNIGNAIIDKTVTKQEMLEAVNYVTE